MRNGRRGENFRPVVNENSSRHSTGRQWNNPSISDATSAAPAMARQTAPRAAWTRAATASGPGSAANRSSSV